MSTMYKVDIKLPKTGIKPFQRHIGIITKVRKTLEISENNFIFR